MPSVLFISQDLPYTFDNRIKRETATLRDAGARVSVISPRGKGESWHDEVGGIQVYRYAIPTMSEGFVAHLGEYAISLSSMSALAALVYRRHGFQAIHAANPPDLLWTVAAPYKALGVKFVFDHHDLVPELFEWRFGRDHPRLIPMVKAMEKTTFKLADQVISTNETYRRVAIERGGKKPEDVTVVRNGPRLSDFPPTTPDPVVRALGRVVVGYLGNMNPQDGVDHFLEMARILRKDRGRTDIGFVMVGTGDSYAALCRLRDEYGLTEAVRMTGRVPWPEVLAALSATDICVQPDPPGGLNDHSTMNKLMEYMALGKAVVSFDLTESRVSGGDAAVYAPGDSAAALADAVQALADDPERRARLGAAGRARVEQTLAWHHQQRALIGVYDRLFPGELRLDPIG